MADSSVAQNNICQRNAIRGNGVVAQPARKRLRRATGEPVGVVSPASGLDSAEQQVVSRFGQHRQNIQDLCRFPRERLAWSLC